MFYYIEEFNYVIFSVRSHSKLQLIEVKMKNRMLSVIGPTLIFVFIEEILQTAMEKLWQLVGTYGVVYDHGTGLRGRCLTFLQNIRPSDRQALTIAMAMLLALVIVIPQVRKSIRSWEGIGCQIFTGKQGGIKSSVSTGSKDGTESWDAAGNLQDNKHIHNAKEGTSAASVACWLLICICLSLSINIFILLWSLQGESGAVTGSMVYESTGTAAGGLWQGGLGQVGSLLLSIVVYGVVSPFAEEAVFRGSLFGELRRMVPLKEAVLFSALVFGVYHGNPAQALYAFIMGILFALVYAESGAFGTAWMLHGMVNLVVLLFSYTGITMQMASPLWGGTFLLIALMGLFFKYSENTLSYFK